MTHRQEYLSRWLKLSFPVGDDDPSSLPLHIRSVLANLQTGQDEVFEALDRLAGERMHSDV
jgi:hypothetical protein